MNDDILNQPSNRGPKKSLENRAEDGARYGERLRSKNFFTIDELNTLDNYRYAHDRTDLLARLKLTHRPNTLDERLDRIIDRAATVVPDLSGMAKPAAIRRILDIMESVELNRADGSSVIARSTEAWPTSGIERHRPSK